jgi:imidazolonepropionase-like amidohydrolase
MLYVKNIRQDSIIMKNSQQYNFNWNLNLISGLLLLLIAGCSSEPNVWENINEEGSFLVYRRQSQIGEESFNITSDGKSIIVKSLQGENERGRITGVQSELRLDMDLSPIYYETRRIANSDTVNILRVDITPNEVSIWEKKTKVVKTATPSSFFPIHSNVPAAIEMMLYHYYFEKGIKGGLPILPRGEVSITAKGKDIVEIQGEMITLSRFVVEGINWGGRTIWLDESNNLIALVKANTQIRELIRKGYEEAMPLFIAGNVEEQMNALSEYTKNLQGEKSQITAYVGADIIDGLNDITQKDMTLIEENGRIKNIGTRNEIEIPTEAKVIDVTGKTLMPGLWEMHAHSNQVQWAPSYLAAGVTTIRDNGNEIEFATAFRDAIEAGALGPDILLAGMTDGPGAKGNGVIRARTPKEAVEVVKMYNSKGYKQIKIYTSIKPDILKILATEAHAVGMTVTGHVPRAVGNTVAAVESGMDMLTHRGLFLSVLFPDKTLAELRGYYLTKNEVTEQQIQKATEFLLKHNVVLDPTIALDVVRSLPRGTPIEVVEPDAGRIAYELFEGKRFRSGLSPERSEKAINDYIRAMEIIGDFYRAGVPIVAGTDNVVPVYSLYLEIESYHKFGKLTPFEAIKTATIIPAKAMGLDAETGTLEIGKEADIAILNKNPLEDIRNLRTVSAVVTNGNYYDSDPLWEAADFVPRNN